MEGASNMGMNYTIQELGLILQMLEQVNFPTAELKIAAGVLQQKVNADINALQQPKNEVSED